MNQLMAVDNPFRCQHIDRPDMTVIIVCIPTERIIARDFADREAAVFRHVWKQYPITLLHVAFTGRAIAHPPVPACFPLCRGQFLSGIPFLLDFV